jgi:cation diffusion facilitator CzcD-associated flavoprotein CzcO
MATTDGSAANDGSWHVRVAIIGAGFAGIGTAIRLKRRGVDDFVILERADDLGGAWRDNTYPGCACDVPSHLYSFSFAANAEWPKAFSSQAEIWSYLRRCATDHGLLPHLRLRHEVVAADWDEQLGRWIIQTSAGALSADVLVAAAGPLADPSVPNVPGLDSFAGTAFHSARWRHDHDLTGRRVAVVGTGASAIQIVPSIALRVARLDLFQRTPAWVLPRRNRTIGPRSRRLLRSVPGLRRVLRAALYAAQESTIVGFMYPPAMRLTQWLALRNLRRRVPDPALRAKLTPGYRMGCKRVLFSDSYPAVVCRDNVDVVTESIAGIEPAGIRTADGVLHEVDTIVFATGFHVTDAPIAERIRGRDGASLAQAWRGSPRAYLGTTVSGFPNLFLLLGPNTGLGHNSVLVMLEAQMRYFLAFLDHVFNDGPSSNGHRAVEPTEAAQTEFVATVDRRVAGTVWSAGGCQSWYQDVNGRVSALWPGSTLAYRWRLRRFDPSAYTSVSSSPVASWRPTP